MRGEVPPEDVRKNMLLWVGCIAGALEDEQYRPNLRQQGFKASKSSPHAFTASRMRGRF